MENFFYNATTIIQRWSECRHNLEVELCAELSYIRVQLVGQAKTDSRNMAMNNINYRIVELVPHAIVDDRDTRVEKWYDDKTKVSKAQIVFDTICKKFGFQFIGIETVRETVPVFVVKVGEI